MALSYLHMWTFMGVKYKIDLQMCVVYEEPKMEGITMSSFIIRFFDRLFISSASKQIQKSNVDMGENNNYRASSHELIIQGIIDSL